MDVIYTAAPLAMVEQEQPTQELLNYNGIDVYAQKNADGRYQVVQVMSTNPADFLRRELYPGSVLNKR